MVSSDLEGGAGTPPQVWLARPETWSRGEHLEGGHLCNGHVTVTCNGRRYLRPDGRF